MSARQSRYPLLACFIAMLLVACSRPEFPRYPSWEPPPEGLPTISDRERAHRYLEQSRLLWEHARRHNPWNPGADREYSYVRAVQRDDGGFSTERCPECPRVSIQSYGDMSIRKIPANVLRGPGLWLCRDMTGAFPPYSFSVTHPGELCQPIQWRCPSDPKRTNLFRPCDRRAPSPAKNEGLLLPEEVCQIDPNACPMSEPRRAMWYPSNLFGSPLVPLRAPTYWEIGKRAPLTVWSFPATEYDFWYPPKATRYYVRPALPR